MHVPEEEEARARRAVDDDGQPIDGQPNDVRVENLSPDATPQIFGERAAVAFIDMFPDTDRAWIRAQLGSGRVHLLQLLALRDRHPAAVPRQQRPYERLEEAREQAAKADALKRGAVKREAESEPVGAHNYHDLTDLPDAKYRVESDTMLLQKFRKLTKTSVRRVALFFRYHYAPTFYALRNVMANYTPAQLSQMAKSDRPYVKATIQRVPSEKPVTFKLQLQRHPDKRIKFEATNVSSEFQEELEWMVKWAAYQAEQNTKKWKAEKALVEAKRKGVQAQQTAQTAQQRRAADAAAQEANVIDCPVCWNEDAEDAAVSCTNGHRACVLCVGEAVNSAVAGAAPVPVHCLQSCNGIYLREQLVALFDEDTMRRLDDEEREQSLNRAGIKPTIEHCPHCAFEAEVPFAKNVDKVFRCPNVECGAETCRLCALDWNERHWGRQCDEMVVDEVARLANERVAAIDDIHIRPCPRCGVPTQKDSACNHITCTKCHGATTHEKTHWCYWCRKLIDLVTNPTVYTHFCIHYRDSTNAAKVTKCIDCDKCMLWVDMEWYDNLCSERINANFQKKRQQLSAASRAVRKQRWAQDNNQPAAYGPQPPPPPEDVDA